MLLVRARRANRWTFGSFLLQFSNQRTERVCTTGGAVRLRCSGSKACQVSLTGAEREWTVALSSSRQTYYGQSRKRSSKLNASG
ncbi:hypothetical protein T08_9955 [Trichinella sp. T8]|nr:hypothetical protein T08_9955 [Trichinella sp. T8]